MLQCNEKIIKHKVGLLNLAEELGNVSKACQIMGLSRDTFYRYRDAVTGTRWKMAASRRCWRRTDVERMLRIAPMSARRKRS